jgi:hypothetical protein
MVERRAPDPAGDRTKEGLQLLTLPITLEESIFYSVQVKSARTNCMFTTPTTLKPRVNVSH